LIIVEVIPFFQGTLRKLWKAARSLQAGFEKALAFGISNLCLVANFPTSAGF